ncbi:hypothetical protein SERLA73DRAFT_172790 [Serpula lacrymans var. lacrymans S7.3]|uniref:Uncharacterized protein n=2 Tax=Serpula lacrymans var. lacrymans TaxID=341189 RepID=F8QGL8_SERL3|nr:uncharacterized protein SERLADRAFT_456890 [Serpula lacrymans var. lacrymans S7.9]EGN92564.1 hypothetical protein SERLA73DRAFT_172790 [Serpula lacrymans var. lacrymans S7.3]EGO29311.1 hypothetical protein SERLADRAFT_456890 [Serpula lacrymans var. lacrymans S7.9]
MPWPEDGLSRYVTLLKGQMHNVKGFIVQVRTCGMQNSLRNPFTSCYKRVTPRTICSRRCWDK